VLTLVLACAPSAKVTLVNTTDRALRVRINEAKPIEINPGMKQFGFIPTLILLSPISISAWDERDQIVSVVRHGIRQVAGQE